tara:strand:- start:69 stop:377 length:309 start_codon:yes stop_codon:yes gene_type:complete
MRYLPRDYTPQEKQLALAIENIGLRYVEQFEIYPYTVDFYIPDIKLVIEADGTYGHLSKRDRKRDAFLLGSEDVDNIIHIKEKTEKEMKIKLWEALTILPEK